MICDAQILVTDAVPLQSVPRGFQMALLISLYCAKANMACDPQTLVENAKCIECAIAPGMQLPVLIYLAAQIAGVSPNSQTLVDNAKCIECSIPEGMQLPVLISLACQMT